MNKPYEKYFRDVSHLKKIDIYRFLELYGPQDHSLGHAVKKLVLPGARTGEKPLVVDVKEARDTLDRWLEMREEDKLAGESGVVFENWPEEAEERMIPILQNGNNGEHYDEVNQEVVITSFSDFKEMLKNDGGWNDMPLPPELAIHETLSSLILNETKRKEALSIHILNEIKQKQELAMSNDLEFLMKNQITGDVEALVKLVGKHDEWSVSKDHEVFIIHKSGFSLKIYVAANYSEGGFEVNLHEAMDFLTVIERQMLTSAIEELLFVLSFEDRAKFFKQVWRFVDKQSL